MMHMSRILLRRFQSVGSANLRLGLSLVLGVGLAGGLAVSGVFSPPKAEAIVPGAFAEGFSEIVEKVGPAVVNVAVTGHAVTM